MRDSLHGPIAHESNGSVLLAGEKKRKTPLCYLCMGTATVAGAVCERLEVGGDFRLVPQARGRRQSACVCRLTNRARGKASGDLTALRIHSGLFFFTVEESLNRSSSVRSATELHQLKERICVENRGGVGRAFLGKNAAISRDP